MKVASWNVNSLKVRLPQVEKWLAMRDPDIVGLQETKLPDENFPREALEQAGYHVACSGQKTYNGVALLSREPLRDIITDIPGLDDPQRRILGATIGDLRVLNLYVVNGQTVGSDKYDYKLRWLEAVRDYIAADLREHDNYIVMGDFNIAPTTAMCTTRSCGGTACWYRSRNAWRCARFLRSASRIPSACTSSRSRSFPGGITARRRFAATAACASISSSPVSRWPAAAPPAASIASRAPGSDPRIMRRSLRSFPCHSRANMNKPSY